jgi:hypothetical protein
MHGSGLNTSGLSGAVNLDEHGLPIQSDGDKRDQLQRCGMIATAQVLTGGAADPLLTTAVFEKLQVSPGVYTRFIGGSTDNVSADQLIPIIAFCIAAGFTHEVKSLFKAMMKRGGFAQNYRDGLSDRQGIKVPDLMLFRAAPLFARAKKPFYPLAMLADIYLMLMALTACLDRHPDHVDDNNLVMTLIVCNERMPTPISRKALQLYKKFRAWNYGCTDERACDNGSFVYGALRHYHRAEAGGNPEVADLWRPLIQKSFRS